jgi:hypothetical protein
MSNRLRPPIERFDGSKGRVDWMEGGSLFMLDNNNNNDNNNQVGMVKHCLMQWSTLFPELSTIKFGIASESPILQTGQHIHRIGQVREQSYASAILGSVGRIVFLDQFKGPTMQGGRGHCKGGAHAARSTAAADSAVVARRTRTTLPA